MRVLYAVGPGASYGVPRREEDVGEPHLGSAVDDPLVALTVLRCSINGNPWITVRTLESLIIVEQNTNY